MALSEDEKRDGFEVASSRHGLELRRASQRAQFHGFWLYDNRPSGFDPSNGQRLHRVSDVPDNCQIEKAEIADGTLKIVFDLPFSSETVQFNPNWLWQRRYTCSKSQERVWHAPDIVPWKADITVPTSEFSAISSDKRALAKWLGYIRRFGFAKLAGGPVCEGALFDIVALFGYVRETNYGRLFDVRAKIDPTNLAYTRAGLQVHTDNPYRDPVPSLQLLYCLDNSATGGENQIVDGFAAALNLKAQHPQAFELLTQFPVGFTYEGEAGVKLSARKPLIELTSDREMIAVRFNHRSLAPLSSIPFDKMKDFYQAMRSFAAILDDPAFQICFKLEPGESFMVDNLRVLHGRKPFIPDEEKGGSRWLQGCYPERDGLLSTLSVLRAELGLTDL